MAGRTPRMSSPGGIERRGSAFDPMTLEDSSRPLSPEERARLRPTVIIEALERLLSCTPAVDRPAVLLGFYEHPTALELLGVLRASGVDEGELLELREMAGY